MSFSKNDLLTIKSKIKLSSELEKKTKVIKKGKDFWCCCPFHEEKTPSCKINDDQGSYYCFGCGAKGDIFTIYTDLYNFSFPDAVKELAQRVGIRVTEENFKINKDREIYLKIIEVSTIWFQQNLIEHEGSKKYLEKRLISDNTIKAFRIGYSYNSKTTLFNFLKNQNFKDEDIIKSNVVKVGDNNKIKDFFYKRLIFPISNEQNKIIGFGGRVLDNSNPKYINSPESNFFKKRNILYNLNLAKQSIRKKNNLLICEGYMDVISLYENNIKTAVAPLGTALTETQLLLSWKYVDKPTIMFDGDNSGMRAAYKSALMALPFLSPNKFLQFIRLPEGYDPDTYVKSFSLAKLIGLLKDPLSIINFIFEQSSLTIDLNKTDNKISYDKYLDDIIETIKDKKIKYFYKNEIKNLFFQRLKFKNKSVKLNVNLNTKPLIDKQINSFLLSYINHPSIRDSLKLTLNDCELLNNYQLKFINFIELSDYKTSIIDDIKTIQIPQELSFLVDKISDNTLSQLFPYSRKDSNSEETLKEINESVKNLNTRLLNLKKINKSLNEFGDLNSSLTWDDLKTLSSELHPNSED
tara:strand:+ start:1322 stop:3058 length:1737 start_codon:yes stop_codon:yes gene_type:complete